MNLLSGNGSGSCLMLKRKLPLIVGAPGVVNRIWAVIVVLLPLSSGPKCITDLSNPTTVKLKNIISSLIL